MSRTNTSVETLTVHLVEDRRAVISRWGLGNSKLGERVYTFSRLPGKPGGSYTDSGTCPGMTAACGSVCYAKNMFTNKNALLDQFYRNTIDPDLSGLPEDAEIVRIHVSGDFDSVDYIESWIELVRERPEVRFFGYTRSWALQDLYGSLIELRDEPNVQLFASVDEDHDPEDIAEMANEGWRLSWMGTDMVPSWNDRRTFETPADSRAIICLEATGQQDNCQECGYCIVGQRGDVVFPIH